MFTVAGEGSRIGVEEAISLCGGPDQIGSVKFDQLSVHSKSEEAPRPIGDHRFTATSQEGGDSASAQPAKFPEYALQIVQT
jgi:hypothetical protein